MVNCGIYHTESPIASLVLARGGYRREGGNSLPHIQNFLIKVL